MNGLKLLTSSCVLLIAIMLFIHAGAIAWSEGFIVLLGMLLGGHIAIRVSRHIPQPYARGLVIFAGTVITVYFFNDTYAV